MSSMFNVGDLVVLQNATSFSEYDGWLAVVIEDYGDSWAMDTRTMEWVNAYLYEVQVLMEVDDSSEHPGEFCCMPHQMRRLGDTPKEIEMENRVRREASLVS